MHAFLQALIIVGNLADVSSTVVATNRPGVVELNPLMPNRGTMIAVKGGQTAAEMLIVQRLWSTGHKTGAVIAALAITGANGFVAAHNLQQGRH